MPSGRDVGRLCLLLLAYASLTVWLTWPLGGALASRLPCTEGSVCPFDTVYSAWVVSWISHALTTMPWHVADANIYYPDPLALYYGPAGLGAVPYALAAFVATGNAAVAINTALLSCITLTAVAVHWVVWRWTGSTSAGFIAAWTLFVNRWFLWGFIPSTPHLAAIQYLPLIVFLAAEPLRTWRQALLLFGLIVVQCLTDPVYNAPAVLLPLGLLALARLARRDWRASGARLLGVLALVPVALAPFVAGYVAVRLRNPSIEEQSPWKFASTLTVTGVLAPNATRVFWAGLPIGQAPPILVGPVVLGLIAAGAAAALALRRRRQGAAPGSRWMHAALWVVVGTFISFTPIVNVSYPTLHGTWQWTRVHLPQHLLAQHTPLYDLVRVPARLGVVALVGFSLLAGLAVAELGHALTALGARGIVGSGLRGAMAAALAVLMYRVPPVGLETLPSSYPVQSPPQSNAQLLAKLRETDGPLLELPVIDPINKRLLTRDNAVAMYRSTFHWRPLVNGYSSYWPADFWQRAALTDRLPAAEALNQLVCATNVRTILVNLNAYSRKRQLDWLRAKQGAYEGDGLHLIAAYPSALLFSVTATPTCAQPTDGDA